MTNDQIRMSTRSELPTIGFAWKAFVGTAVLYVASYVVLRWQHVLVRRVSCYVIQSETALRGTSEIGEGYRYGDDWIDQTKEVISPAASALYKPLTFAESTFRNQFSNVEVLR